MGNEAKVLSAGKRKQLFKDSKNARKAEENLAKINKARAKNGLPEISFGREKENKYVAKKKKEVKENESCKEEKA